MLLIARNDDLPKWHFWLSNQYTPITLHWPTLGRSDDSRRRYRAVRYGCVVKSGIAENIGATVAESSRRGRG